MSDFEWTEKQIKDLRELWDQGLSAGQIAARFSGVSRNAIIGKARRLGLSSRKNMQIRPRAKMIAPPKASVKPLVRDPRRPVKKADPVKSAEVKRIENRPAPMDMPKPLFKHLFDLNHNDCRWPVSGEKASTLFCGHPSEPNCSYCAGHKRMSVGAGTQSERNGIPAKMVA